jgi:MarR family transcriptional regulator, lower aerobic nicotinate degradation pathway regulator
MPTYQMVGVANKLLNWGAMRTPPGHAGPPGPARVRDRATWLISRAYLRSSGLLSEGFEAAGGDLRGYHYRLLAALEESGPASQASLGRSTGIDRSDVTAVLAELEDRGLVERTVDAGDRRRNLVSMTPAGMAELARLDQVISGIQDRLLAPLSAAEQRRFLELLRRVADGASPSP